MAVNGGFEEDPLAPGCYSQLLLGDEISGLETDDERFGFASSFSSGDNHSNIVTPKMLCFGDCAKQSKGKVELENVNETRQKSEITRTVSLKKKRGGSRVQNPGANSGALTGSQSNSKKPRPDNCRVSGHPKVVNKKEKLGERITALRQLVSPFAKTDTASVLHEASGYIRFLQDQVQVLCSPYSPCWSPSSEAPPGPLQKGYRERKGNEGRKCDLRSRGLCLVPVELTLHICGLL